MARNTGRPVGATESQPPFAEAKRRGGAFGRPPMTNPITTLAHWFHGLTAWLTPADLHDVEEDE